MKDFWLRVALLMLSLIALGFYSAHAQQKSWEIDFNSPMKTGRKFSEEVIVLLGPDCYPNLRCMTEKLRSIDLAKRVRVYASDCPSVIPPVLALEIAEALNAELDQNAKGGWGIH